MPGLIVVACASNAGSFAISGHKYTAPLCLDALQAADNYEDTRPQPVPYALLEGALLDPQHALCAAGCGS